MKTYKIQATQLVYFTVLVEAENEEQLDDIVANVYPDDCYEHPEIDWQIDAIVEANPQDLNNFPLIEVEKA
jgi:hypothetical protein